MKSYILLLGTVVSLGYALSPVPPAVPVTNKTVISEIPKSQEEPKEPANSFGYCFFGDLPSASCMFQCFMKDLSPTCDEDGWCICNPYEDEIQNDRHVTKIPPNKPTDSIMDLEDPSDQQVTFYIFDLSSLFGDGSETESDPEPKDEHTSFTSTWSFSHILAILVLLMLTLLVAIEVLNFCRRRSKKELVVQSIINPPEKEKHTLG